MTRHGFHSLGVGLLLGAVSLGLARPTVAGDPVGPEARAAVTAAAIETANLRAKAKLELARILDREGRMEEALAALLEADRILAEAARLAADGRAATPERRPPGARPVPSTPPAPAPGTPVLLGPVVPGPESHPVAPRPMPRRDPVVPAVRWLLGHQNADGSFRAADGRLGADPAPALGRDVAVTAAALLAVAEVAIEDDERVIDPDDPFLEMAAQATASAARAAGFLLATAKDDGSMAASLEDHCLAGWAVASALSRLGSRLVAAMPKELGLTGEVVERKLGAALRHALEAQDPATGRLAGVGTSDRRLLGTLAFVGFMHEVEPLPLGKAMGVDPTSAWVRVSAASRHVIGDEELPRTPAGYAALSLLRHDRLGLREDLPADAVAAADPTYLLYGTVCALSIASEEEWVTWWREVLVPAMNAQAVGGAEAGSFPTGGDPLGRTHATALSLLAWLYPDMEWRAPVGD